MTKVESGLKREFDKMMSLIVDELQPLCEGRVEVGDANTLICMQLER